MTAAVEPATRGPRPGAGVAERAPLANLRADQVGAMPLLDRPG